MLSRPACLLLVLVAGACDPAGGGGEPPCRACPTDAGPPDVGPPPSIDAGPDGEDCLADGCAGAARCDPVSRRCVDPDRCAGIVCAEGERCVDGACVDDRVHRDDDGDGVSDLDGDCDDTDPGVHPGAEERCDRRDQDCDGEADEGACPDGCRAERRDGHAYVFCERERFWPDARSACMELGMDLVKMDDEDEDRWVRAEAAGTVDWYIGGNDRDAEGDYRWADGSPITIPIPWGFDQPNGMRTQNCIALRYTRDGKNGAWHDRDCTGQAYFFVCEDG